MIDPDTFAARCREINATLDGHDMHRAFDALSNALLAELGYGEGVEAFKAAVAEAHHPEGSYPYWARGERNGLAKLDPAKVREIRQSTEAPKVLAERMQVSLQTISHIRLRKTWRHCA